MPFSRSRDDSGIEWPRTASFDLRGVIVLHCSSRIYIHLVPYRILCLFFGHQTVLRNSSIWNLTWPDRNRKPLWSVPVNISKSMSSCWILIGLGCMNYPESFRPGQTGAKINEWFSLCRYVFDHRMIQRWSCLDGTNSRVSELNVRPERNATKNNLWNINRHTVQRFSVTVRWG